MRLFDICATIFLVLDAPASFAYPFNMRSQSLALTNDVSPAAISQVTLTKLVPYPVYSITCFPAGHKLPPSSYFTSMLRDCYWIINDFLLQQHDLLFQNLLFGYTTFKDLSGQWRASQWHHGKCAISVASAERLEKEVLKLFNVVLAATKILRECIQDKWIVLGGTTPIGSPNKSFYVAVLGTRYDDMVNESNRLRVRSNAESSVGEYKNNDSIVSVPPSVRMERRASAPQPSSSLSTLAQDWVAGGVLSIPNLASPSTNISRSVKAPPTYPITCFNPYSVKLNLVAREDCEFIINHIILRYPNPMLPQTFGYTPSADIDISLPQNERWVLGKCTIFVRNVNKTRTDTFRIVDIAYTAHRIMTECVIGKYPLGGISDVGTVADNFYVGVGGPHYR